MCVCVCVYIRKYVPVPTCNVKAAPCHTLSAYGSTWDFRKDSCQHQKNASQCLLPTDMIKARVYEMYKKLGEGNGELLNSHPT